MTQRWPLNRPFQEIFEAQKLRDYERRAAELDPTDDQYAQSLGAIERARLSLLRARAKRLCDPQRTVPPHKRPPGQKKPLRKTFSRCILCKRYAFDGRQINHMPDCKMRKESQLMKPLPPRPPRRDKRRPTRPR